MELKKGQKNNQFGFIEEKFRAKKTPLYAVFKLSKMNFLVRWKNKRRHVNFINIDT